MPLRFTGTFLRKVEMRGLPEHDSEISDEFLKLLVDSVFDRIFLTRATTLNYITSNNPIACPLADAINIAK
jgi:hypothetical protein